MRHLDAAFPGQVGVEQELLLQLQRLVAAVGLPAPPPARSYWGDVGVKRGETRDRRDIIRGKIFAYRYPIDLTL